MLHNQKDHITNNFLKYLENTGLSTKSFKNYKSDIGHFTAWAIFKVKTFGTYAESLTDTVPFITDSFAKEYKKFLVENNIAKKTINRRLSTLRHLARFLIQNQILEYNFMDKIENLSFASKKNVMKNESSLLIEFRNHLKNQKVSKNTMKNYLSDINQFLAWLESQPLAINH